MRSTRLLAAISFFMVNVTDAAPGPAALKLHPKVFSMVECWISDEVAPVVTEFNLEALEKNENQFLIDDVKQEDGWTKCPNEGGTGFLRYRVLEATGNRYKVEFQSNGGGTLTSAYVIDLSVDKREIQVQGKEETIKVLRVLGFSSK